MFGPIIEKKLSRLLGAQVTFGNVSISLLRGSVEADDMVVAGGGRPLLKIKHIKAEVSIAKAMSGQIAIKSLLIDRPVATIVLKADGTTNLSGKHTENANDATATTDSAQPTSSSAPETSSTFQFSMRELHLTGGEVHFHDETGGSNYHVYAEQISGQIQEQGRQTRVSFKVDSFGRRDSVVVLPPVQLNGSFASPGELSQLLGAAMQIELTGGNRLRATIASPGVGSRKGTIDAAGTTNLKEMMDLIPPRLQLPVVLKSARGAGPIEITARAELDGKAIHVNELRFQISDIHI
jgi:uncharacterized protein involved in outer membrane biogenesis